MYGAGRKSLILGRLIRIISWSRQLPYIVEQLRNHPHPYVDRATLEFLLGISRRRAQQFWLRASWTIAPASADSPIETL